MYSYAPINEMLLLKRIKQYAMPPWYMHCCLTDCYEETTKPSMVHIGS